MNKKDKKGFFNLANPGKAQNFRFTKTKTNKEKL
jgi:hypothetical protein